VGNESVGEVELRFAEHQQDLHAARNQPAAGACDMAETLVDPDKVPGLRRHSLQGEVGGPLQLPDGTADNAASKRSSSSVRRVDRRPRQPAGSPRPDLGPDQTPAARTLCRARKQYPLAPIQPSCLQSRGSPGPRKMSVTASFIWRTMTATSASPESPAADGGISQLYLAAWYRIGSQRSRRDLTAFTSSPAKISSNYASEPSSTPVAEFRNSTGHRRRQAHRDHQRLLQAPASPQE